MSSINCPNCHHEINLKELNMEIASTQLTEKDMIMIDQIIDPFKDYQQEYFKKQLIQMTHKLRVFQINGLFSKVIRGPVVDTFIFNCEKNLDLSRFDNLSIKLKDEFSKISEGAPIRFQRMNDSKYGIRIEIPYIERDLISLNKLLNSNEFKYSTHKLPLLLGVDVFGSSVIKDLTTLPNLLVTGATGAGKSVFIDSLLCSLIARKSPEQLKLVLFDFDEKDFSAYREVPHLLMPITSYSFAPYNALKWLFEETKKRLNILSEFNEENLEDLNLKIKMLKPSATDKIAKIFKYTNSTPLELPYIVVVVNELALVSSEKLIRFINNITNHSSSTGIHLIFTTTYLTNDALFESFQERFTSRAIFKLNSHNEFLDLIDNHGAEDLAGKGDMLFKQGDDLIRLHSAISEDVEAELSSIVANYKDFSLKFDPEIIKYLERDRSLSDDSAIDEKYDDALELVKRYINVKPQFLQRKLGIGFNRAAYLIEAMKENGDIP